MMIFHELCAATVHMRMKSHECIVIQTTRKSPSGNLLEMQSSESMRPLAYFQEKKSNGATGNGSTRTADAKSKQTTANFD